MASLVLKNNTANGKTSIKADEFIGNATTATNADKLDGKHELDFMLNKQTYTGDLNECIRSGCYKLSNTNTNAPNSYEWSQFLNLCAHGTNDVVAQMVFPYNDTAAYRAGVHNGSWTAWKYFLDSSNYTKYAPSLTGTGATGTWNINISGTANVSNFTNVIYGNEINFWNNNTSSLWFNYRNPNTGNDTTTRISEYIFGNGQKGSNTTLTAGYFRGTGIILSSSPTITYNGSKGSYSMIRFLDNTADEYGNGISIGGGGASIIGGGESASAAQSLLSTGGDERMIIANDADIDFYANCQNGMSSSKRFTMTSGGLLKIYGYGPTITIGSQNTGWCHFMGDKTFYFNQGVCADGPFIIYSRNSQGCGSSFPSNPANGQIFFKI